MLSFAAVNEARMRSMISAHDNTLDTLETTTRTAQHLRQQDITDEIVELSM